MECDMSKNELMEGEGEREGCRNEGGEGMNYVWDG